MVRVSVFVSKAHFFVTTHVFFLNMRQEDAQGSVSPLRVRMKRVSALRTCLASVVGGSLIRVAK